MHSRPDSSLRGVALAAMILSTSLMVGALSCGAQNASAPGAAAANLPSIPDDAVQKISAALPDKAQATPLKPRRLLVFTLARGYVHSSIPYGARALEMMGQKTGAYTATISDDIAMLEPQKLNQFDAICMVSTTGEVFDRADLKKSLTDFVGSGKGLIGIHAATDAFYDKWPEYGALIGGFFNGHPWHENVSVRVEDTRHPVNLAFGGAGSFEITDEIYQFKEPYARNKQRVLLSLDMNKTAKKGGREDLDHAVSWIKNYGRGRVFYCSLGHREEIYWNPVILRHYLAGIQYAMGDLKADATPVTQPTGAIVQKPSDPVDAVMGEYAGNFQWNGARIIKAEAKVIAEGGGNYRVVLNAPVGEGVRGHLVNLEMSGKLEADKLALSGKDKDLEGTATLAQGKMSGVLKVGGNAAANFNLSKIVRHSPTEGSKPPRGAVVLLPFAPNTPLSFAEWTNQNWIPMTDGSAQVSGGDNKTKREFGDMRLHVEFMTPYMPEARGQGRGNSGVYLQERYEVQVLDAFGLPPRDNEIGGIYTIAAPKVNAALPPLSWQTYDMTFRAPRLDAAGKVLKPATVTIFLNGIKIHDNQELPRPTGGGAPDIAARGPIKLQDHGNAVRYRNIWVVELTDQPDAPKAADKAAKPAAVQPAASTQNAASGWRELFNGKDLEAFAMAKEGAWKIEEDGALVSQNGGDIWTKDEFGDFVIDMEVRVDKGTNSGIFIRNPKPGDWFGGIEIQILDSFGKETPDKHDSGAVYDVLAPSKNTMKAAGEWNRFVLTVQGQKLQVAVNGEQVVDMDLDRWTEAGKNPDGSGNKFGKAYKDMPKTGHIELQDHGNRISFRNIKVKKLP